MPTLTRGAVAPTGLTETRLLIDGAPLTISLLNHSIPCEAWVTPAPGCEVLVEIFDGATWSALGTYSTAKFWRIFQDVGEARPKAIRFTRTSGVGNTTQIGVSSQSLIAAVPGKDALFDAMMRKVFLRGRWETNRRMAFWRAMQKGAFHKAEGTIVFVDLTAPTNGTGADKDSPRNTLFNYSLPNVATVTLMFAGGIQHQLPFSSLFADGANLSINTTATRRNIILASYDPATGEQVWEERKVATLVSHANLVATNPASIGRPVVRFDQAAGKGRVVVSGLRLHNPYNPGDATPGTCYDMVHVVNTDVTSTVKLECVYGADFPLGAQVDGYVVNKAFSVSGQAVVEMRFLRLGNIYADAIWIQRNATGSTALIEWCDLELHGSKQDAAGPDCIQFDRLAGANLGAITIANSFLFNPRNQKALALMTGGTLPSSGESLLMRNNICIGVDTTVQDPAPPELHHQANLNTLMHNVSLQGNYIEGTAIQGKLMNNSKAVGNVFVRDARGQVLPGVNWFACLEATGSNVKVFHNTFIAYGNAGGSPLKLVAGATGQVLNNAMIGAWDVPIDNQSSISPSHNWQWLNIGDVEADLMVDPIGRPVPGGQLSMTVATAQGGAFPGDDFLLSEDALPPVLMAGAMQVFA